MSTPVVVSSSWRGLIAVLAAAALVIAGLVALWQHVAGQAEATQQRIRTEFIVPYMAALQAGDAARAWRELTTESYRARYKAADFAANFATVIKTYGRPTGVEIVTVTATIEPDRAFEWTQTDWSWEKGRGFTRTFQLVDVPGAGFRMDGATLGGRNVRVLPNDVPTGPW